VTDPTNVVFAPIITEKSERLKTDANKYTFRVLRTANKVEIRNAVQKLFKVHVTAVHVINYEGKLRRMGRFAGRRPDWKKAVVTVKKGETIEALER
jgi:large subunit ribosomal protein L23